jgi:CheY-like chemotaxis protein
MFALSRRRAQHPPDRSAAQLTICVVDPRQDGCPVVPDSMKLVRVGSAAEALRLARAGRVDCWVVSAHLPDMTGCELCELVRIHSPQAPVLLVADMYSAELERAAYRARATSFAARPAQVGWLAAWTTGQAPQRCRST